MPPVGDINATRKINFKPQPIGKTYHECIKYECNFRQSKHSHVSQSAGDLHTTRGARRLYLRQYCGGAAANQTRTRFDRHREPHGLP